FPASPPLLPEQSEPAGQPEGFPPSPPFPPSWPLPPFPPFPPSPAAAATTMVPTKSFILIVAEGQFEPSPAFVASPPLLPSAPSVPSLDLGRQTESQSQLAFLP